MISVKSLCLAVALAFTGVVCAAEPVDINKANAAALAQSIQGVGPERAKAIVEYREKVGGFKTVDELLNVPGIGPKILEDHRDHLSVGNPAP
jgi:competence protein ComEA